MAVQFPRNIRHLNKTLGPGPIWLGIYRRESPPSWSPNFIRAIVQFARYKGFTFIPVNTVARLKSDRYFKYCFSILVASTNPYHMVSFFTIDAKGLFERMKCLINNPEKAGDEDIEFGLSSYMNNFPSFMPGGGLRRAYLNIIAETKDIPKAFVEFKREIDAIDEVLGKLGLANAAARLGRVYEKEYRTMPLSEKLEYMKICIQVFEILMDQYGFSWKELNA